MRSRPRLMALVLALAALALLAVGCGGDDDDAVDDGVGLAAEFDLSGQQFTVGSKEFTEQLILGEITKQMLEATGADVRDETGLEGSVGARNALTAGRIDMYWEYTGTAWFNYLDEEEPIPDEQDQFDAVAERDLSENDVVWLEPFTPFNNTFALAVRSDAGSEVDDVETLSDLAALVESNPELATFCLGEEFSSRPDGFPGVERTYGFEAPEGNVSLVGDAVVYQQVARGDRCNFGSVFATDGRIEALDLRVLEDDEAFFPFFNVALNVGQEVSEQNEELGEIFAPIAEALTEEVMTALNAQVDVEGERVEDAARAFLEENEFIG